MKYLILLSSLSFLSYAYAQTEKLEDIGKVKLNSYIENIKTPYYLESQNSTDKGKADLFWLFKGERENKKDAELVLQAFDLNKDGKIDLVKHYKNTVMIKTEVDQDFDGKTDSLSYYDPSTKKLERSLSQAGKNLSQSHWYNGELRLQEIDRNQDLKADMWLHFRDAKVFKIEDDDNFDGKDYKVILK